MSKKKAHTRSPRTAKDRALDEIYAEIPRIPDCTGACADACGPIAAFKDEWDRVTRAHGRRPRLHPSRPLTCPMLSSTGRCMVYTVRPFICRLWGTTPTLACPQGCQPERWVTLTEARDLLRRISEIAGPETDGTIGSIDDLWGGFALEAREERQAILDKIKEAVRNDQT